MLQKVKGHIKGCAVLLCAVLCFSACAANSAVSKPVTQGEATPNNITLSENARMITDVDGIMGRTTANTENGQYYLTMREDGGANIVYVDYATRSRIYLCNRPECTHGDASCVSWISAEDNAGGAGLFTDGKTLYILRLGRGTEMGQPEETLETSASQIQRMDLNGENRELVIRLDGSDCIASSIVEDQDTLYFLRDSIEQIDDEIPVVRQLVAMDMAKKAVVPIVTVDLNTYLVGVCDAGFVLKTLETQSDKNLTVSTIYLYRTSEGTKEIIKQWTEDNIISQVHNNRLFYLDANIATLTEINLDTKEEKIVIDELPLNKDDTVRRQGFFDERFCYYIYEHGESGLDKMRRYVINLDDRSLSESTLSYTAFDITWPVSIAAENSDYFLVCYNKETEIMQFTGPDGSPYDFEGEKEFYGLILKTDYWNNIPNYIPIENTDAFPRY